LARNRGKFGTSGHWGFGLCFDFRNPDFGFSACRDLFAAAAADRKNPWVGLCWLCMLDGVSRCSFPGVGWDVSVRHWGYGQKAVAAVLRTYQTDETFMGLALELARRAAVQDEVPVGAVVVVSGRIVARAHNQVEMLKDATAHAEMIALTQASSAVGDWRLTEATLYVTKEPCAMCAGAAVNARLGRLVYGCCDPRTGAAGGALDVIGHPGMLHRVDAIGGVLATECLELIQEFFRRRRAEETEHGKADE